MSGSFHHPDVGIFLLCTLLVEGIHLPGATTHKAFGIVGTEDAEPAGGKDKTKEEESRRSCWKAKNRKQ